MVRAASVIALFMHGRKKLPGKSSPENATGSRAREVKTRAADDTSFETLAVSRLPRIVWSDLGSPHRVIESSPACIFSWSGPAPSGRRPEGAGWSFPRGHGTCSMG